MPLQTWVTFRSDTEPVAIQTDNGELLDVLGKTEDAAAIKLAEVLSSVREAIQDTIEQEGELQIELSGSLELKGTAGVSYLIFNVGGETSKVNTMTITFKTKISRSRTHSEC